jgi:thiamine biosynthesis lipoprotein
MGTDVELLLDAEPGEPAETAFDEAEAEFERLEQVMSRFRDDSELSRLNRDGRAANASEDLVRVVELALEARSATGGLFDPTVLDALVAAGYDRSFDALPAAGDGQPRIVVIEPPVEPKPTSCAGDVRVVDATIELGPGTHLDLGGIGKGYAVDRVADDLSAAGPCLVNAGGDLAVRGGAWPVGVTDEITLELTRGGMATSGRDRRRWQRGGEEQHHLIDPSTGLPAADAPVRVTVVAGSATAAEVAAKTAFFGGQIDLPHVIVTADGCTLLAGGLA